MCVGAYVAAEYTGAGRKGRIWRGRDNGTGEFEAEDEGRDDEGAVVLVFASRLGM